ncbi:VOC family protein [Nocardioides sp.]|uniref:VOC family protein n=1 Tax=Nocardioides sp. TaxID=35761 RepID=UPI0031FED1D1|nr:Glyoxalase/bleomycin resistance protein/dioxygenase [Nocardioides sp.]
MSLADSTVAVMLPITDTGRAQEFYGERLELPYDGTDSDGSLMYGLNGGSELVLRQLPAGQQSTNTAMSFKVDDIATEVGRLEKRGVVFENYDEPGFTTVDHIFDAGDTKAAWFLDPDGNILCLHETKDS